MSHDLPPHYENDVLVVSNDQARVANTLTEKVIGEFTDDQFDWPTNKEDRDSVERMLTSDGSIAIVATRACVTNEGTQQQITHYILDLSSHGFVVLSELQDLDAEHGTDEEADDPDSISAAVANELFDAGFNQASFQDWSDFIDILVDGQEYLSTLRSLEAKTGMLFGKAATRTDWDLPGQL